MESMDRIDRRTLLKLVGAAGAWMGATTACSSGSGAQAAGLPPGAKFDRSVELGTEGPGGNPDWKPGDTLKFLPPERIPTSGKASDLLASQPKEKLLMFYERMVASRKWEAAMKDSMLEGKDGLRGIFHMSTGEEACAMGVIGALNDDDYVTSTHRGHHHLAAKGADLNKMAAELFLKDTGYNKGYGGSMHITDFSRNMLGANGIVGASFYIASGAALVAKARGTKQVSVAYFGDGAAASVYYFSAIRNCANFKIPTLFVCENNFYWVYSPVGHSSPTKWIADYTKGLGIPHYTVDGNDMTAVFAAAREAAEWGRAGNGPSMIELVTYRWYDHSSLTGAKVGQDGGFGLPYRTDDEVRAWIARDPITRYKTWLVAKNLATEAELAELDKKVQADVDASMDFARNSPNPAPEAGLLNTYASGPLPATQFYDRKGLSKLTT